MIPAAIAAMTALAAITAALIVFAVSSTGRLIIRRRESSRSVSRRIRYTCCALSSTTAAKSLAIIARQSLNTASQSVLQLFEGESVETAPASAWCCASTSFKRSLKGFLSGPVFMENISFEPPAFIRFRVADGDVGFALSGKIEARALKRGQHAWAIMDRTGFNPVGDPVMDQCARLAPAHALNQADGFPRPFRRKRIAPAEFLIQHIAKGVVVLSIAGRHDIEAAPALKLHARRHEMQFDALLMGMTHPENIALVELKPGKGQTLESLDH